jgi:uncharacterized protein
MKQPLIFPFPQARAKLTRLHVIEYCPRQNRTEAVLGRSSGHRVSPLNCYYGGTDRVLSPFTKVIEISERVEVPAAARIVWDVLSDPRAVVDCVPGAKLGDRLEDGSYDATVTVKFGPAKVTFRAKIALDLDGTAMIGHVSSRGRDDQGGTRVKTAMTFKVVAGQAPGSSAVPIDAQVEISGRLASLVESGAALVVKRMTGEFTERLAARCAKATA